MNLIFTITYCLLILITFYELLHKNIFRFLIVFAILFSFSPLMQYVIYPEYKTEAGYRDFSFGRIYYEYFNTIILILANLVFKTIGNHTRSISIISVLILSWIGLNTVSLISSIDILRSLNGLVLSVINPLLYIRLFNHKRIMPFTANFIIALFSYVIIFNLGIKFGSIVYNFGRGAMSTMEIGYSTIDFGNFRSNSGTNFLAFFLPLIYFNNTEIENRLTRNLFKISKFLMIFTFIITGSRTGYIVLVMTLLAGLFIYYKDRSRLFGISFIVTIALILFISINTTSFTKYIEGRFTQKGDTAVESALNDERLALWGNAIREIKKNKFIGIGMGNYPLIHRYGNPHNLFITLLYERGIAVFIVFLCLIFYAMRQYKYLSYNVSSENDPSIFRLMQFGLILYLISSFTGEAFISISQTVHVFPSYIFIIFIMLPFYFSNYQASDYIDPQ